MLTMTDKFNAAIKSPVRTVQGKIDLCYKNGTSQSKIATYTQDDYLKSIKIERIADEGKFFGFGVSHKVNVKLRDVNRELNITVRKDDNEKKRCFFILYIGAGGEYTESQRFYITETHRDENTNELSITAYDALYFATTPIGDITGYTITSAGNILDSTMLGYAQEVSSLMINTSNLLMWGTVKARITFVNCTEAEFIAHEFAEGANFESTHTCREVLDDIAEATHTIYYINNEDKIVFKRPDRDGDPVLTLTRSDYITLKSGDNRRLAKITNATELGDNVSAELSVSGTNQIMWDNGFLTFLETDELTAAIDTALANLGGMTINQFDCSWRGNPALEPGDKVGLITKDGETVYAYCYNDTITYDGGLEQSSEWKYTADEDETESTPTSLGEAIKQVYAKVDRVNKNISLVVGEEVKNQVGDIDERMSAIEMTTEDITASVTNTNSNLNNMNSELRDLITTSNQSLNEELAELTKKVEVGMTEEDVTIAIQQELSDGVTAVTTTTGFTFNDEGLSITKSGSEMETTITEDGMTVCRDNDEVLVADNTGVRAENLHATTFLIIGETSRFEDYTENYKKRTGCFWIS